VVRPQVVREPGLVPEARWLQQQRVRQTNRIPLAIRPVLQGGLAVACALLMVVFLVSLRQIERANRDVFAVSEAALTHVSSP
jgi:hypothetical protein